MYLNRLGYNSIGLMVVMIISSCIIGIGSDCIPNPPPDKIFDVYFALSNVEDPGTWHSSCQYKPSNDFYRDNVDNNGNRDLFNLVSFPYDNYGNTYWFEFGGDGKYYCLDDDTWSTPYCQNKLELKDINTSYPQIIWVNLNSQCHKCGDYPSYSGTWWKYESLFNAGTLSPCNNPAINLSLKSNHTTCNAGTNFGCGIGEVQD